MASGSSAKIVDEALARGGRSAEERGGGNKEDVEETGLASMLRRLPFLDLLPFLALCTGQYR